MWTLLLTCLVAVESLPALLPQEAGSTLQANYSDHHGNLDSSANQNGSLSDGPNPLQPDLLALIQEVGLQEHDKYRDTHNTPPLSLANDLDSDARDFATYLATLGTLEHAADAALLKKDQGENLAYMCTSRNKTVAKVTRELIGTWYNESCLYDFDKPGFTNTTGHFSQIVWSGTTEIGLGMATAKKGGKNCYFLCARYRPLGNVVDGTNKEFRTNVKKGRFNKRAYCLPNPVHADFVEPAHHQALPKLITVM